MTPARPRVEGDREDQILDATLDLLIEVGYQRLTLDAVAKQARASKATLYRRWDSKTGLVIDALIRAKGAPQIDLPDTGTLRGDLLAAYCRPDEHPGHDGTHALAAMLTALSTDEEFATRFRAEVLGPKSEVATRIFERARERGEVREDLDLDLAVPALTAMLLHRSFVLGLDNDEQTVARLVDQMILPAVLSPDALRVDS
ncbi:TetR family transcriptional regulator [Marmoricola endophyticus]|uniref:TetR family transcriptional regulator n=1 Tax=Marmoricola endophyticus TaxID=2040280 RepID=A0A917BEM0_9ACTN|nr:TetR/AcrR family transcriptional regulator [Marmoricola endophyticus]GGF39791.1 TetR family transcriptional regulator [Marmoricola endophyticus]